MKGLTAYLLNPKIKNIIILTGVLILALHGLFFIQVFGVNIPYLDGWDFVPFVQIFLDGGPFWEYQNFLQHNEHRPIFPSLILLVSVVLTSWNVVYLMYFGWSLIALSVGLIYLILKKTYPKLIWLIIPIAAFMFNPAQYENLLWGFTANAWFLVSSGIILSIYFLTKVETHRVAIIPAILFGVVASFSEIAGLVIWLVGAYSLINLGNWRKSSVLLWVSSAVIVFILYFTNFQVNSNIIGINFSSLLTFDGIKFVLLYLSNGLIMKFDLVRAIAGFAIILLIIGGPIYLKFQKIDMKKLNPWIQFGLVGLFSAGITELARFSTTGYIPSRYITMAVFAPIAALVIGTIIFMLIYNNLSNHHKKIIISIIFSILIVMVPFALSTSYYIGWVKGEEWFVERSSSLDCLLNPIFDFKCPNLYTYELPYVPYKNAKILQDLKLGPFADQNNLEIFSQEVPLLEDDNWKNMTGDLEGFGVIDSIDVPLTGSDMKIYVNKSKILIPASGWGILGKENAQADSVYVFIDNKVHNKAYYGLLRKDIPKEYGEGERSFSGWSGVIDLRELSDECHNITIRLVKGNHYHEITTSYQMCLN